LSMLLVMQSLKNKDNIVDLDTNASNAN
jgi:hypothetical protein